MGFFVLRESPRQNIKQFALLTLKCQLLSCDTISMDSQSQMILDGDFQKYTSPIASICDEVFQRCTVSAVVLHALQALVLPLAFLQSCHQLHPQKAQALSLKQILSWQPAPSKFIQYAMGCTHCKQSQHPLRTFQSQMTNFLAPTRKKSIHWDLKARDFTFKAI